MIQREVSECGVQETALRYHEEEKKAEDKKVVQECCVQ